MQRHVSSLIRQYESGHLDRRQLVVRLASLAAAFGASRTALGRGVQDGAGREPTFVAKGLNHIALRVTDVPRSRDFYVRHLGLRVTRDGEQSCFLDCGKHFLALFKGREAVLDHYCYSIDDFDVDAVEAKLKREGFEPRVVRSDERIYFDDPDGHTVQLAETPR